MRKNPELVIDIADEQSVFTVDLESIRLAVVRILEEARIERAQISVALVDDPTIRELNRRYLEHDYATDVLSFVLESSVEHLDGQIVVSTETAQNEAVRYGWSADDELLLYVIHGALHLVGYDDATPEEQVKMREREKVVLGFFGLKPRWSEARTSDNIEPEERTS
ncbi:MAG: rRNA maturation RNase YbeY [Pirellulales bacterium]|nr:rRNA maturation RNase YbeY [Pirellulales bacterium]